VGLITCWAFYGIIQKHEQLNLAVSPDIIQTAWIGFALVAVAVLYQVYRNAQSKNLKMA
jgi:uncharacterized protein with PQ loop repeat